ncbi:MAG: elongation factor G [Chitinophagales bacterium]|nr:elongation factor G [Chitinophagales bacterium]
MKIYNTEDIRNVVLLGHSGSGKTTFAEAMLFEAGVIGRRGSTLGKNTVSDYHEIEQERGNTIFSSLLYAPWKDSKINIIDTPGLDDFVGELIPALRVGDTGVMMINAQHGVEVGTEMIWEYVDRFKTPTLFVVNQVDHEKSDFELTLDQVRNRFGNKVLPMQYPYNQGEGFNAIIDALKMVMYVFPDDGGKPKKEEIPDDHIERAQGMHNALVEAAAENDEALMEVFFDAGTLSEEEMTKGLRIAIANQQVYPLFCCSSEKNMGSGRVMGFIHDICPSPADVPPVELENGETLKIDSNGEKVAFIFKTVSEQNLGNMSFFKVYSGEIQTSDEFINADNDQHERLNQLYILHGKNRENVDALKAGDIGSTVKLKNTHTNNTLLVKGSNSKIRPINFPASRARVAVRPPNKSDIEKLANALHTIREEDPTLHVEHSQELRQTILHGMGSLHLDIVKWKIEHLYKMDIDFMEPRIPYRETIQKAARSNYRHKKQSGGAGQFGEVHLLIEPYYEGMPAPDGLSVRRQEEHPLEWGGLLVFNNCIVGGAIDAKYMNAILKGVLQKMHDGPLTGSYCRDIRVSIYDGKMHPVDSNDMAFQIAGAMAFKSAFQEASPQLLEPIYELEVLIVDDVMGDVMSDLQSRRSIILGMEAEGHFQKIKAKVPLSELYMYTSSLKSLTQGRSKFSMKFTEFAPVPHEIQQKLIEAHQEELQDA